MADSRFHLQWNAFAMKQVERPAPVLMTALDDDLDGFMDAAIRLYSFSKVVSVLTCGALTFARRMP